MPGVLYTLAFLCIFVVVRLRHDLSVQTGDKVPSKTQAR